MPTYRLGVRPARSTRSLWSRYSGLVDGVNENVQGFRLRLESAQTEARYEAKLRASALDVAVVDPHQVLEAEKSGYGVFARAGNTDRISGVVVVSRDGNVRRPADLRDGVMCFPSPSSLAATMMVRLHLAEAGLPPQRGPAIEYTGSQESALLKVHLRTAAAAGVSHRAWESFKVEHERIAAGLEAKWRTPDLPGPALMAAPRVRAEHVRAIRTALLRLRETEEGREALHRAGFTSVTRAEAASYDEVWEFLNHYRRVFGRLPETGAGR